MTEDQVTAKIRELLWDLDPLGVADFREEAPDEYDAAIWEIRRLSATSPSSEKYKSWWTQYVEDLGLAPRVSDSVNFADRMLALKH